MNVHGLTLLLPCVLSLICTSAQAQGPTMEVISTNYLAEYDNKHPGPERVFEYTIRNTSPPNATNNLVEIFFSIAPSLDLFSADWNGDWFGYGMTVSGWDVFGYMAAQGAPPGGTVTLKVVYDVVATRQAYITASSAGGCAFAPALVEAPPARSTPILTNLVVNSNTATLTAQSLVANSPYVLEESTTLSDWTNSTPFWITRTNEERSQTFSLPILANTGARFFRIRSP